jgi:hypothetical protein
LVNIINKMVFVCRRLITNLQSRPLLFFLFLSPGFWWLVKSPLTIIKDLLEVPRLIKPGTLLFDEVKMVAMGLTRWPDLDQSGIVSIISKLFYNRITLLLDDFFTYLTYLSPRLYFQAGDGSTLSPSNMEPIPMIFFPLAIWGLIQEIKLKRFKRIFLIFASSLLAYFLMRRGMQFLWPILLIYIWFSVKGFVSVKGITKLVATVSVIFYSFFLGGRIIWTLLTG